MSSDGSQLHPLTTELTKIEARIQHMRHVTYRITSPEVVARLDDHALLYAALHSLNQLIDDCELVWYEFDEEVARVRLELTALEYTSAEEQAIVLFDLDDHTSLLLVRLQEFRNEMAEHLISADMILDCFTAETSS